MDLVVAAGIADFKQIFGGVQDESMKKLLGIRNGAHTLWIDDFEASREALPVAEVDPNEPNTFYLDAFLRPQLSWMVLGDAPVRQVTEANLKEQGRPVAVKGQGLQAEYRQQPGALIGFTKPLRPGSLQDMDALRFIIATEQAMTLLIQLEEISGGKYNTTVELPAETKPSDVRLVPMLFEAAQDSKDNNNRLDLSQVKQVLFIDATGFLGGAVADNVLWLSALRIETKVP
jgi:hypothetical protein